MTGPGIAFASLFLLLLIQLSLSSSEALVINDGGRKESIVAKNGVVAADDGRCSIIGRDVLQEGGHAIDASVAVAFCLGVVSPASSGIGGGAFIVVRSSDGKTQAFDMRETAPIKSSVNMYAGNITKKASGPLSVAVPGEVLGLHEAWKNYGKLPWKRLVMPAVRLARDGFMVSPYLRVQMVATESGIMADRGLRNTFTSNGISLLQIGEKCYNRKLARTLAEIAKYGPKVLYNGSIGYNLAKDVLESGGILTMDDLRQYRVKLREPVLKETMGVKVLGMPPPSSGGAAMILMLNILAQYGNFSNISIPLMTHREIETLKHAFAVRMNLGDPDFSANTSEVLSDMLSTKFAKKLHKTIYDNMTFSPSYYGGRWNLINDHGTSHISIVDSERNAVSMTSTINGFFGAKFLSTRTGIILNNEMDDFSMPMNASSKDDDDVPPPTPENFIHPGKRPLSSMTPTIILKGDKLKAVVGASGGSKIIAGTAEVFLNHFVKGMDPLSSVMAPRNYHQLIPNVVEYEDWKIVTGDHIKVPKETRDFLEKRGHVLRSISGGTICQFVVQDKGKLTAVSDPRKGGFPAGF